MIRARVIGAAGFGGANIIELLTAHPGAEIVSLVDVQGAGLPISAQHSHLKGICDLPVSAPDDASWDESIDLAFTATPDPPWALEDLRLPGDARKVMMLVEKAVPCERVASRLVPRRNVYRCRC